jgi:hypothetical protein
MAQARWCVLGVCSIAAQKANLVDADAQSGGGVREGSILDLARDGIDELPRHLFEFGDHVLLFLLAIL